MQSTDTTTKPMMTKLSQNAFIRCVKKKYALYLLLLPTLIATLYFSYIPMIGTVIAFQDYDIFGGIFHSDWVGMKHFINIFTVPDFSKSILNTLYLSALNLLITQPAPLIFALLLNEIRVQKFKRTIQTVSYLPHFLSYIAVIGLAHSIFSTTGVINDLRVSILGEDTERIRFLASQGFFVPLMMIITVWKSVGWASIIYLAAITGIDPQLYEAACVDGAGRFKQCLHITVPSVLPTAIMIFIIQIGHVFGDNFDLVYGLQNPFIEFETISTIVYKHGIKNGNYSASAALGLFQGLAGLLLVTIANKASKKINDVALW